MADMKLELYSLFIKPLFSQEQLLQKEMTTGKIKPDIFYFYGRTRPDWIFQMFFVTSSLFTDKLNIKGRACSIQLRLNIAYVKLNHDFYLSHGLKGQSYMESIY